MINIEHAKNTFNEYVKEYDISNDKIKLKVVHTYEVLKVAQYISNKLNLDETNAKLAELIALLHDIGRFEQLRIYNSFIDAQTIDHAQLGVQILFEQNLIRKFIEEDTYDQIIYIAISNHNKYKIEGELSDIEFLHAKIIRDADKLDNFRVKEYEQPETLFDVSEEELVKEEITELIYQNMKDEVLVKLADRKTHIDMWVSYLAFIFDLNFKESLQYIDDMQYVDKIVDRFKYTNLDTLNKMNDIREILKNFIKKELSKG